MCVSATPIREVVLSQITRIRVTSEDERLQWQDAADWVDSGAPLFRVAKSDRPGKHLVSYFPVIDGEYVLLVDHRNAKKWLPPGGHVEPDEDPRATVIREIREELGIHVTPAEIEAPVMVTVTQTVGLTRGHTDVSLWYLIRRSRSEPLVFDTTEFDRVRWFHLSEVRLLQSDPNLGHFLSKLGLK